MVKLSIRGGSWSALPLTLLARRVKCGVGSEMSLDQCLKCGCVWLHPKLWCRCICHDEWNPHQLDPVCAECEQRIVCEEDFIQGVGFYLHKSCVPSFRKRLDELFIGLGVLG